MEAVERVTERIGSDLCRSDVAEFDAFVRRSEERLRIALVAAYGPSEGRQAAVDALSWAWEHWAQVQAMKNPVGYLFRVGQTAARRLRSRPIPFDGRVAHFDQPNIAPELAQAMRILSPQQRTVVLLVHAFGWTLRETADVLGISHSTVQVHANRGLDRLRQNIRNDQGGDHAD